MIQVKDFDLSVFLMAMGLTDTRTLITQIREESDAVGHWNLKFSGNCDLRVYLDDQPALPTMWTVRFGVIGPDTGFHIGFTENSCLFSGGNGGECEGQEIQCAFSSAATLIWAEAERGVTAAVIMKQGLAPFFEA